MNHKPTLVMLGGSGFIGSHLAADFAARDWRIIVVTRSPDLSRQKLGNACEYIMSLPTLDPSAQVDLVINLAGASVGEGRWSDARKQTLIDSRLGPTRQLHQWLKTATHKPARIIQASAVGYYGNGSTHRWQPTCDEESPPQDIFVSQLCQQWEAAARQIQQEEDIPVSIIRLGVVLGQGGGILPQLLKPVSMGVGRIGSGQQPLPWIHIDDVVAAIHFISKRSRVQDPGLVWNLTAPADTRQLQFAKTVAQQQRKRLHFGLPAGLMRLLMGEQADLVLDGQFVSPARLLDAGYTFRYPTLDDALRSLLPPAD
ncbi:MAG: TIGR01777 family oxidoreductase [Lautropia sp.]|nr:TIGR01777 family oxidoreductase [Lautropia sp.]